MLSTSAKGPVDMLCLTGWFSELQKQMALGLAWLGLASGQFQCLIHGFECLHGTVNGKANLNNWCRRLACGIKSSSVGGRRWRACVCFPSGVKTSLFLKNSVQFRDYLMINTIHIAPSLTIPWPPTWTLWARHSVLHSCKLIPPWSRTAQPLLFIYNLYSAIRVCSGVERVRYINMCKKKRFGFYFCFKLDARSPSDGLGGAQ